MPRLLILLGLLLVAGMLLRQLFDAGARARQTYRPRRSGAAKGGAGGETFIARRTDMAGLRDAFSAEPIDPDRALVRCAQCQSYYHADSLVTLRRENGGRCASCGSTAFDSVEVVD